MELHQLYFEFIFPFWERAKERPDEVFSKTFACMASMEDEDDATTKMEQVYAGIDAACNELAKMTSLLLSVPMLFLAMSHPDRGTDFLRATLAVLSDNGIDVGEGFGPYQYDDPPRT
mmetsp:Transcript_34380/g.75261  ORF Transcript_34380/g.75261 Transcript_34380/m.75261 type:complete len:117 (+) Transcript_34380:779-1129(+)